MPAFVDHTGETFNGIKIIQELRNDRVIGECIYCRSEKEYNKGRVVRGSYHSCGCTKSRFRECTGSTFNGIKIIQDLGKGKVIGKCIYCGSEREYIKSSVTSSSYNNCGCKLGAADRIGDIQNNFKIIKKLDNKTVVGECLTCHKQFNYSVYKIIYGEAKCKNKDCVRSKRTTIINRVGQNINGFNILEELRNNTVKAKCLKCGRIDNYRKSALVLGNLLCINCGINSHTLRKIENHIIKNITVLKYEYTGRDNKPYYTCKCNKCGEEILLSYKEIFTYQCQKE